MDVASILTALAALGGVGLGALLSSRQQQRMLRAADDRSRRQDRQRAYIDYLVAYRQFRRFLLADPSRVTLLDGPEGRRIPTIRDSDELWKAVDEASATVKLISGPGLRRAGEVLDEALWMLADACAQHKLGKIPDQDVNRCRDAERKFAAAAHDELVDAPSSP